MSKYRLEKIHNPQSWDDFVQKSSQANIFFSSKFLSCIGRDYELFLVRKGQQVKAGLSLLPGANGKTCELDDFVIYNGIVFADDPLQIQTRRRSERFEITEFVIDELDRKYLTIEMALVPEFKDLRPFLWHNYHSKCSSEKFTADLRYTSFLDISEFFLKKKNEEMGLYHMLDNVRKSDLRKGLQKGLRLTESKDYELFVRFYDNTLQRQGVKTSSDKLNRLSNLVESLVIQGLAKLFATLNADGQISYMTVFTLFKNSSCYLFGAGDAEILQRYDGTFCLWESMRRLADLGINTVDLEGVNSPRRGWFKLSFGGDLRPYYQVSKSKAL